MAAGSQAGAAYVTVTAAMDKGFSKDIEGALGDAGEKGGSLFNSGLLDSVKGMAGPVLAAIGVAEITSAIADIGRQALDAYADYEQLSGGMDKLFGDAADTVRDNAQQAFSTAGLSANEYMETVTGFSAALVKSVGGDTQKAAEQADKAITDMSDNANTFGTDIESLQNAYKGFARENYTMLDNLSLGYAGSQEGMEQLLADAEAISGVHYDIHNYSDVVDAIHEVQVAQKIAGTTAKEAAGTVSGSTASMNAAWQNWLTELGKSDADMDAVSQQLAETVVNVARNTLTVLGNIVTNGIQALPGLAAGIGQAILTAIGWEDFKAKTMQVWTDVRAKIDAKLLEIENAAKAKFNAVKTAISTALAAVVNTVNTAKANVTAAWNNLTSATTTAWNNIKSSVSNAITNAKNSVSTTVDNIKSKLSSGFDAAKSAVTSTFDGIRDSIFKPIETAYNKVKGFIDDIKGVLSVTLSFPHIKTPHFNITGGEIPWGIGGKGTPPSVSVDWYGSGGIVRDAQLVGAGERGTELIWPSYDPYMDKYARAIARHMPQNGVTVTGNTFIVRKESDIDAIAYAINRRSERARGARL